MVMRKSSLLLTRQLVAAGLLSFAASGQAGAADLTVSEPPRRIAACVPREVVVLFDERGHPTVPARTPYFYCVTGTTLLPRDIPPPPEYCCS
jgi:hypothetical protein